jgi:predicted RNase H-like HicB family nuclease
MYCFLATFVPHPLQPGRYDVTFYDLPGCVTSGDTWADAMRMAQEALTLHLGAMLEDGDPIPNTSTLETARQADEDEAKAENDPLPQGTIWQYVLANPSPRKAKVDH